MPESWPIPVPASSTGVQRRKKGTTTILTEGQVFEDIIAFYRRRGAANPIDAIVLVKVERALALISPAYDLGLTEDEVRRRWEQYWASLKRGGRRANGGMRQRSLSSSF